MKSDEAKKLVDSAAEQLMADLEAGKSDALKHYLSVMAKFTDYSFGNCMLIARQKPDASHVAGFVRWKQFGRYVKKGEKGIMILAPMVGKKRDDAEQLEETPQSRLYGFKTAFVFDVSQTDGEPLPEFSKTRGNPAHHLDRLKGLVASEGIALEYTSEGMGTALGKSCIGTIKLQPNLTPAEEFAVLVHEYAHEKLHPREQRGEIDKNQKEVEAESVAFVVCAGIGLDTNTAARDYIQTYNGKKENVLASLERIKTLSRETLERITEKRSEHGARPSLSLEQQPALAYAKPPPTKNKTL
jgi:antirestriction protein ArdC